MNKYLKSAYRNLVKRRLFSFVNIISLTFGLVCALFIGTYVIYEFSYDKEINNSESVFRINNIREGKETGVIVPTAIKPYLDDQVDQVELSARVQRTGPMVFRVDELLIRERNGYYADPEILDILSFKMASGSIENAFKSKESILISEELSKKYFNEQPAFGKEILLDAYYDEEPIKLIVGGVFKDVKANNHLRPDYLINIEVLKRLQSKPLEQEWSNSNCFTYLKIQKGVNKEQVDDRVANILVENSEYDMTGNVLQLQPLSDIHMQDFVAFGDVPGQVRKSNLLILSGIGLLIILLVCINFFNMSTARSLERAKEIGVRKSIGASRGNVMIQFMTESALQVTIGLVFSMILFEILGDSLTSFTGLNFNIDVMVGAFGYLNFVIFTLALWCFLVVGSGFYPALIISKFKPVDSLKGQVNVGKSRLSLSKVLLVLQFTITLTIGIIAVVVYSQVKYMQTKDPGFQREAMVSVDLFDVKVRGQFEAELKQNPLIEAVSFTDSNVIEIFNSSYNYRWTGKPEGENIRMYHMSIDDKFMSSMGLTLLEGRNFDKELVTDKDAIIINEAAAKLMGIQSLESFPTILRGKDAYEKKLNVIGLVKNFQSGTLREQDKPMILYQNPNRLFRAHIKLSEANIESAIAGIEGVWNSLIPDQPFEYRSLDEGYERILSKDKASGNTLLFFTVVSVAISFFGLFGMTSLNIQARMKELGIRKILGAHYKDIFGVVSKEFKYTMLIAFTIGVPVAWLLGSQWLNKFTHRIDLTSTIPLLVVSSMAVIGLLTIYFCTKKFIKINPVQTLREN